MHAPNQSWSNESLPRDSRTETENVCVFLLGGLEGEMQLLTIIVGVLLQRKHRKSFYRVKEKASPYQ